MGIHETKRDYWRLMRTRETNGDLWELMRIRETTGDSSDLGESGDSKRLLETQEFNGDE